MRYYRVYRLHVVEELPDVCLSMSEPAQIILELQLHYLTEGAS